MYVFTHVWHYSLGINIDCLLFVDFHIFKTNPGSAKHRSCTESVALWSLVVVFLFWIFPQSLGGGPKWLKLQGAQRNMIVQLVVKQTLAPRGA